MKLSGYLAVSLALAAVLLSRVCHGNSFTPPVQLHPCVNSECADVSAQVWAVWSPSRP